MLQNGSLKLGNDIFYVILSVSEESQNDIVNYLLSDFSMVAEMTSIATLLCPPCGMMISA